jgi:hypothetical protein
MIYIEIIVMKDSSDLVQNFRSLKITIMYRHHINTFTKTNKLILCYRYWYTYFEYYDFY